MWPLLGGVDTMHGRSRRQTFADFFPHKNIPDKPFLISLSDNPQKDTNHLWTNWSQTWKFRTGLEEIKYENQRDHGDDKTFGWQNTKSSIFGYQES